MLDSVAIAKAWEERRRQCARVVTHVLLVTLDAVEEHWEISGKVWDVIAAWLETDPVNLPEFLRLFDIHHATKRGESRGGSNMQGEEASC